MKYFNNIMYKKLCVCVCCTHTCMHVHSVEVIRSVVCGIIVLRILSLKLVLLKWGLVWKQFTVIRN